jgi:hypothetical protein
MTNKSHRRKQLALAICLAFFSLTAWSEPAAWYWWVSKIDGARVCLQTSPGDGWYRERGPYRNARCSTTPLR